METKKTLPTHIITKGRGIVQQNRMICPCALLIQEYPFISRIGWQNPSLGIRAPRWTSKMWATDVLLFQTSFLKLFLPVSSGNLYFSQKKARLAHQQTLVLRRTRPRSTLQILIRPTHPDNLTLRGMILSFRILTACVPLMMTRNKRNPLEIRVCLMRWMA